MPGDCAGVGGGGAMGGFGIDRYMMSQKCGLVVQHCVQNGGPGCLKHVMFV